MNLQRDLCVVWLRFLLVFLMGFVGIFRKFHCEFTKGFMCCLAWIFACFSRIFVGIFRRFHWEFSKGFMSVVWLGILFFWGGGGGSIGFERDFYWWCCLLGHMWNML